MTANITAVFLDIGNTLRILLEDETHQTKAKKEIVKLLGADVDPIAFCDELNARYKIYRKWAFKNMVEAPEVELWTKWLAPEFPPEKVAPMALDLTYQFRQSMGRRVVADGGRDVVIELYNRGYVLGIISNVITSREIPDWLKEDGLEKYFSSVALSSVLGIRKPDPRIYHYATDTAGVKPENSVYVGDNINRDVIGTREAGFGMVIIVQDKREAVEPVSVDAQPDLVIQELRELLDIFPPLKKDPSK
jgi:HAD superfamily hydrolase (TIGR01549 family)